MKTTLTDKPARSAGRRKEFSERVLAPFRKGTSRRIARVLFDEEHRTSFIRVAVDNEIKRRQELSKE